MIKKSIAYVASTVLLGVSVNVLAANENAPGQAVAAEHAQSAKFTCSTNLPVDNTSWSVGSFSNNGSVSTPHSVPWIFKSDGTASAKGHWTATWEKSGCDKVHFTLTANNGKQDIFDVFFVTSSKLIAVKGDNLYRFGTKK